MLSNYSTDCSSSFVHFWMNALSKNVSCFVKCFWAKLEPRQSDHDFQMLISRTVCCVRLACNSTSVYLYRLNWTGFVDLNFESEEYRWYKWHSKEAHVNQWEVTSLLSALWFCDSWFFVPSPSWLCATGSYILLHSLILYIHSLLAILIYTK